MKKMLAVLFVVSFGLLQVACTAGPPVDPLSGGAPAANANNNTNDGVTPDMNDIPSKWTTECAGLYRDRCCNGATCQGINARVHCRSVVWSQVRGNNPFHPLKCKSNGQTFAHVGCDQLALVSPHDVDEEVLKCPTKVTRSIADRYSSSPAPGSGVSSNNGTGTGGACVPKDKAAFNRCMKSLAERWCSHGAGQMCCGLVNAREHGTIGSAIICGRGTARERTYTFTADGSVR